jgi:UDP-N-acetylglucosamine--N-acetylmuramyl-(pentapeptide) pyrophosphoryl-undecaprenol N-acetylglucosamine transferase
MRVLSVGGGSGGHVTPVLAVLNELSKLDPTLEAAFVCDRAFEEQSRGLMKRAAVPVSVHVISAGKYRRYHGSGFWSQLSDVGTLLKNFRDVFLIGAGYVQSLALLRRFKPDVVFAKGGYVCLPVGYAAKTLGISVVIHDSDTRPGLTNTLLSKFAVGIATGSPLENYPYAKERSVYTGVPIDPAFHPFTSDEQTMAKRRLHVADVDKPLVVVTGGGLGAKSINDAVVAIAPNLIEQGINLYHITGKNHYDEVKGRASDQPGYQVVPFIYEGMADVLGAANLVIARGSATFLQELAALAKPVIIIPGSHLGDQVKNAAVYAKAHAAVVLSDEQIADSQLLQQAILSCFQNHGETLAMADRFHAFARPDAALDVARLIVRVGGERKR